MEAPWSVLHMIPERQQKRRIDRASERAHRGENRLMNWRQFRMNGYVLAFDSISIDKRNTTAAFVGPLSLCSIM